MAESPPQAENRAGFAERLSPLIARGGVVPVPTVLLRHLARLNLTATELLYVQFVLSRKWGRDWPYIGCAEIAKAVGVHERRVREWRASLIGKGYLVCTARGFAGTGGRGADRHDLSGLFTRLEQLVVGDEVERARADLPPEEHPAAGLARVPDVPTGKPVLSGRNNRDENSSVNRDENSRVHWAKTPGLILTKSTGEEETGRRTHRRTRPQSPVPESPESRVAAAPPGDQPDVFDALIQPGADVPGFLEAVAAKNNGPQAFRRVAPGELTSVREKLQRAIEQGLATRGAQDRGGAWVVPPAYDEGIWAYLEEWCEEFSDNDPARTLEVVHHLWWNSGLPRDALHASMKNAYYSTQRMADRRRLGRPMAYFLTALRTALEDQERLLGRRAG